MGEIIETRRGEATERFEIKLRILKIEVA